MATSRGCPFGCTCPSDSTTVRVSVAGAGCASGLRAPPPSPCVITATTTTAVATAHEAGPNALVVRLRRTVRRALRRTASMSTASVSGAASAGSCRRTIASSSSALTGMADRPFLVTFVLGQLA